VTKNLQPLLFSEGIISVFLKKVFPRGSAVALEDGPICLNKQKKVVKKFFVDNGIVSVFKIVIADTLVSNLQCSQHQQTGMDIRPREYS